MPSNQWRTEVVAYVKGALESGRRRPTVVDGLRVAAEEADGVRRAAGGSGVGGAGRGWRAVSRRAARSVAKHKKQLTARFLFCGEEETPKLLPRRRGARSLKCDGNEQEAHRAVRRAGSAPERGATCRASFVSTGVHAKDLRIGLTLSWVFFLQLIHLKYHLPYEEFQKYALLAIDMLQANSSTDTHVLACVLYILRVGAADQMMESNQRIFLVHLARKLDSKDLDPFVGVATLRILSYLLTALGEVRFAYISPVGPFPGSSPRGDDLCTGLLFFFSAVALHLLPNYSQ
ncbi:hypothetical protein KSP40_PGU013549 [Platanthera guangdongensis]|uniref:Uncharacterized protein n=1 Tax=Platanthera guangdongensis TaxID=2320717 RepID=A0ABR2LEU3_9ASPA